MSMEHYVIIGNGVAAAGCIEGIRTLDKKSPITVISAEEHAVYSRPLISYYLEGKTTLTKMNYRPKDFYKANKVKVIYGKAVNADNKEKKIELEGGERIDYTSLCIAAGSSPFVPKFEGLDTVDKRFTFMTIDDTLALEKAINKKSRVLIVGAGLIGLKCAEGIAKRVSSVTVCDLADRVLSSILDHECAEVMQKHLEKNGIAFMLGDTAVSFDKNTAVMKSGKKVTFDVLVLAVGVRANISLAADAGCKTDRGIIIDTSMKTSVKGIYAAGDCTQGFDSSTGESRVLAILPNAYMQGRCAGINMAGGESEITDAIPMNSIGFFGLHSVTAGCYFDKGEGEVFEEKGKNSIKRLYIKDGRLTGYIIIGDVSRAGIYTSLVREKTPLDEIDTQRLKKTPSLTIYSSQIRRKKLGGVV